MSKSPVKKNVKNFVLKRDQRRCQYCGTTEKVWTVDHVIPQCAGGWHDADNLVACCQSCNSTKREFSLDYFRLYNRLKLSPYGIVINPSQYMQLRQLGVQFAELPEYVFEFEKGNP